MDDLENIRAENHTAQESKRTKKFINKNDFDDLNCRLIDTPISPDMKRKKQRFVQQTPGTKASTPLV